MTQLVPDETLLRPPCGNLAPHSLALPGALRSTRGTACGALGHRPRDISKRNEFVAQIHSANLL
eukprot:5706945-Prymnesium_polylepis.1